MSVETTPGTRVSIANPGRVSIPSSPPLPQPANKFIKQIQDSWTGRTCSHWPGKSVNRVRGKCFFSGERTHNGLAWDKKGSKCRT